MGKSFRQVIGESRLRYKELRNNSEIGGSVSFPGRPGGIFETPSPKKKAKTETQRAQSQSAAQIKPFKNDK